MRLIISIAVRSWFLGYVQFYSPPAGRSLFSPALGSKSGEGVRDWRSRGELFEWNGTGDVISSVRPSAMVVLSGNFEAICWGSKITN